MAPIEIEVPKHGITLDYNTDDGEVSVAQRGVWAGTGTARRCADGTWTLDDCSAGLGEEAYEAIDKALSERLAAFWHTRPAAARNEASGAGALMSLVRGRWVIHPADYDPSGITDEDIIEDEALRALTVDEVFDLPDDLAGLCA